MTGIRQRWRLLIASIANVDAPLAGALATDWEAAIVRSGLPVAMSEGATPRPRLWFGPPLPAGMAGEREPLDLGLAERRRIHEVREALAGVLPAGLLLADLYDVWPGAPALTASIVAADYRIIVGVDGGDPGAPEALAGAITELLSADRIAVAREKGGRTVEIDIRPSLVALRSTAIETRPAGTAGSGDFGLWMRLRLGSDGPMGRPAELVAAVAARTGRAMRIQRAIRERVVIRGDEPLPS
ncbi:MAG: TIGR03936 family radical SAM-associated protein [Candidatus Limnocylindrales bacterium]